MSLDQSLLQWSFLMRIACLSDGAQYIEVIHYIPVYIFICIYWKPLVDSDHKTVWSNVQLWHYVPLSAQQYNILEQGYFSF